MSNNSLPMTFDNITFIRLIVWGYAGLILSLFGIVGNIITIIVLISPAMRTVSTNIYLTALSCSNIVFLLIFLLSLSIRYLSKTLILTNQPLNAYEIFIRRIPFSPIYHTNLISVIYLTIAISIDRLILIKFRLKAKRILTPRITRIVILVIYIFSIIYCLPLWLVRRYDFRTNSWRSTNMAKKIDKRIRTYIYVPVVHIIPFLTLTCINITIVKHLMARKRYKKNLGAQINIRRQADNYIILILVTVILLFNLCQLPLLMLNVSDAFDDLSTTSDLSLYLSTIGGSLMLFYMSTNFLFYCFSAEKFRQTFIELISPVVTNYFRKSTSQTRTSQLSSKRESQPLTRPPSKQRIFSENSSSTITNIWKKSTDLNDTSNEHLINHQQELSSVMINSNKTTVTQNGFSFKPDQHLDLCTCV